MRRCHRTRPCRHPVDPRAAVAAGRPATRSSCGSTYLRATRGRCSFPSPRPGSAGAAARIRGERPASPRSTRARGSRALRTAASRAGADGAPKTPGTWSCRCGRGSSRLRGSSRSSFGPGQRAPRARSTRPPTTISPSMPWPKLNAKSSPWGSTSGKLGARRALDGETPRPEPSRFGRTGSPFSLRGARERRRHRDDRAGGRPPNAMKSEALRELAWAYREARLLRAVGDRMPVVHARRLDVVHCLVVRGVIDCRGKTKKTNAMRVAAPTANSA